MHERADGKQKCFVRSRLVALFLRGLYMYDRALDVAWGSERDVAWLSLL